MSLIQSIKSFNLADLMNTGARGIYTGTVGSGTTAVIVALPPERQAVVTTLCLTSSSATPILVSVGYQVNGGATTEFFRAYVAVGSPVELTLPVHDWVFTPVSSSTDSVTLVITTSAGTVVYTVHTRIIGTKVPLGYVEQVGVKTHANPYFGPESGNQRGQSEF